MQWGDISVDNFNALILILSKNLLLNLMLLRSALPLLLGKPLMSSGSRPEEFSVSQQQTKTDVCMTLAHLLPLLFPEFTALFSPCFFLKYFCSLLSLFIFFLLFLKQLSS